VFILQVDWEEYYGHYVKTLLRLDDQTIQALKTNPGAVSRSVKVRQWGFLMIP
jgi:hypothetical protein